jgi:NAD(P)-dependent dehydrogenase (short-subunit alcohol dehydrogenase family)
MWSLTGKVILITGGAGGIGSAVAAELARRGAVPVIADLESASVSDEIVVLDVTDRDSCAAAVETTLDRHGRLDSVWANAGISPFGPLELQDADTWESIVRVNLIGAANTVRAALPAVIESRGYVAVTCSLASFAHQPGLSAYSASKAGLEAMADSLRIEVAHQGVDVGTIHPGWVRTPLVARKERDDLAYQRFRSAVGGPVGRTVPVEAVVPDIVSGFEHRRQRVVTPRPGWLAHVLRPALTTRLFTRQVRRAAPDIRRLYADQSDP